MSSFDDLRVYAKPYKGKDGELKYRAFAGSCEFISIVKAWFKKAPRAKEEVVFHDFGLLHLLAKLLYTTSSILRLLSQRGEEYEHYSDAADDFKAWADSFYRDAREKEGARVAGGGRLRNLRSRKAR